MSFLHESKSNWFFAMLWVCSILFGCSACSPYASKRVPIGNAVYMSGKSAQNKNLDTQPSLLCGPDAPCLGPNEPLFMQDGFNDVPVQTTEKVANAPQAEEVMPSPQAKGGPILKTSQAKKTTPRPAVQKKKSSRNSAVKVAKISDKKNSQGAVLSENLNKPEASVSDNFIPLSQVPDKVYTDEQRKEMYEDKEAKQSELNNKASQLSKPEEPDLNVTSESSTQTSQMAAPAASSVNSKASAPSAEDTDKLLTQLIGTPAEREASSTWQDQKEKPSSQPLESSSADVSDAELDNIKIPTEAITNIKD